MKLNISTNARINFNCHYFPNFYSVKNAYSVKSKHQNPISDFVKTVILDNYTWNKYYDPQTNSVIAQHALATDLSSYSITSDGRVESYGGYTYSPQPVEIIQKNETLAKFVQIKKLEHEMLKQAKII